MPRTTKRAMAAQKTGSARSRRQFAATRRSASRTRMPSRLKISEKVTEIGMVAPIMKVQARRICSRRAGCRRARMAWELSISGALGDQEEPAEGKQGLAGRCRGIGGRDAGAIGGL